LAASKTNRIGQVDDDGWGADAPPVTRSEVEKVAPAYKPTKVNMAELTRQKQEPSRFTPAPSAATQDSDVVKGGYQPIGKVDIAAIRAQAKKAEDDRPSVVKGAYEPVGKVDIAAIRAKAQNVPSQRAEPPVAARGDEEEQPKSLADRTKAFTQSERLTALPKPKVASKFAGASSFTGTKPLTPGVFGLHSAAPTVAAPPVGAASRTFADEGGKTPAQLWAEKKARERGLSGAADTTPPAATPVTSQPSGGEWKSGYAGKQWGPVETQRTGKSATSSIDQQRTGEPAGEQDSANGPAGGISALKDRFKETAPMGLPLAPPTQEKPQTPEEEDIPGGFPEREDEEERYAQTHPNIPPPPRVQRTPTPPTPAARDESPIRVAMPVPRNASPQPVPAFEAEPEPPVPIRSLEKQISHEEDDEPARHDTARATATATAGATFGQEAAQAPQSGTQGGKRAVAQYDYEKAEDNELELTEGETVTNIDMVDDDWWMGTNSKGESGLFPSNYVELIEEEEEERHAPPAAPVRAPSPEAAPAPPAAPAKQAGPTATALYDYEAAEDNELTFQENDKITGLVGSATTLRFGRPIELMLMRLLGISGRGLVVWSLWREVRIVPVKLCAIGRIKTPVYIWCKKRSISIWPYVHRSRSTLETVRFDRVSLVFYHVARLTAMVHGPM
jgi:hypothetical protein